MIGELARALLIGLAVFDGGRCRRRRHRLLALSQDDAGAFLYGFCASSLRKRGQRLVRWRRQTLERGDRGVGMLAARGDGFELDLISQFRDGDEPCVGIQSVARNAAERFLIRHVLDGRLANGLEPRTARRGGQLAFASERAKLRDGCTSRPFVAGFSKRADA